VIGNQYGYPQGGGKRNENIKNSPVKGIARGYRLARADFQNLIQVNQFGRRFVNELQPVLIGGIRASNRVPGKAEGGGPIWGHL